MSYEEQLEEIFLSEEIDVAQIDEEKFIEAVKKYLKEKQA